MGETEAPAAKPRDDVLAHVEGFVLRAGAQPLVLAEGAGSSHFLRLQLDIEGAWSLWHETSRTGYEVIIEGAQANLTYQHVDAQTLGSRSLGEVQLGLQTALARGRYVVADGPEYVGQPLWLLGEFGTYGAYFAAARGSAAPAPGVAMPLSLGVGIGVGRLLPATPRFMVALIEDVLRQEGLLRQPLSEAARTWIVELWAARANELGHAQRTTELVDHVQALGAGCMYRIERLVAAFADGLVPVRAQGGDLQLSIRSTYDVAAPQAHVLLALELRARRVINVSLLEDMLLLPGLAVAPRSVDAATWLLPPQSYPGIALAAQPHWPVQTGARVLLDLPVHYSRLYLDDSSNITGLFAAHAAVTVGVGTAWMGGVRAGAHYTAWLSGVQGLQLGLDAGVGRSATGVVYMGRLLVGYVVGSGWGRYAAPADFAAAPTALDGLPR